MNSITRPIPGAPSRALVRAVTRLSKPLVRLMIARGLTLPFLMNLLKTVYVEVAEETLGQASGGASISRLSIATGLQRKDIKRIQATAATDQAPPQNVSLGARLIGIWTGSPRFRSKKGAPATLPRTSEDPQRASFEDLVRTVSTDVRPKAVLEEWLRLGIVELDDGGAVRLNAEAFVPQEGFDEKAYYLGRNVADHIATSVHNLLGEGPPLFERAVYYDRLTADSIAMLRKRARELGMSALLTLNKEALKRADDDAGRDDANRRMALGLYYYDGPDVGADQEPS